MYITENVDIPEKILEAQENGNLVIFAGAGISMGKPSCLPNFSDLTKEIVNLCGEKFDKGKEPDIYLGELDEKKGSVHQKTINIFKKSKSYNEIHKNIIRLFGNNNEKNIKIVTTNFDRHFSEAIEDLKKEGYIDNIHEYSAPAIPRGNNFNGIVYLHGNVNQNAEELILTDKDYGRAYLVEGWAADFIRSLYDSNYTILFLGYSHDDVVLKYLARGMKKKQNKFALVADGSNVYKKWGTINIKAILYPVNNKEHIELNKAIKELSDQINWGFPNHETHIKQITELLPPIRKEDNDYIKYSLRKIERINVFCNYAEDSRWVKWLDDNEFLKNIFSYTSLSDCEKTLSFWLAKMVVSDKTNIIKSIIIKNYSKLNIITADEILSQISKLSKIDEKKWLIEWLIIIFKNFPSYRLDDETYFGDQFIEIIKKLDFKNEEDKSDIIFIIIKNLINFEINANNSLFDTNPSYKIKFYPATYILKKLYEDVVKKNLDLISEKIIPYMIEMFKESFNYLKLLKLADHNFDILSIERNCLDKHNDEYPENVDFLIDILRDCIKYQAENKIESRFYYYHSLKTSGMPLLERFYIYSITLEKEYSYEKKMNLIIDEGWFFNSSVESEIYNLIISSENFSHEIISKLEIITKERKNFLDKNNKERLEYHSLFDRIEWLIGKGIESYSLKSLKESLKNSYNFLPTSNPEKHGIINVPIQFKSPISKNELKNLDFSDIFELIKKYEGKSSYEDKGNKIIEYDLDSLLNLLKDLISSDWNYAEKFYKNFNNKKIEFNENIWNSFFRGIENHFEKLDKITEMINRFLYQEKCVAEIANLFSSFSNKDIHFSYDTFNILISLIDRLIQIEVPSKFNNEKDQNKIDWLFRAINCSKGQFTIFLLKILSISYQNKSEKQTKDIFKELDKILKIDMARIIISSQLNMLFNINQQWTKANLLPLMDAKNNDKATQSWEGYLGWGTYNLHLLKELSSYSINATELINGFDNPMYQNRFCEIISNSILYAFDDETKRGEFLRKFIKKSNDKMKECFHNNLFLILKKISSVEIYDNVWMKWLKKYIEERILNDYPIPFSTSELQKVIDILALEDKIFNEGPKIILKNIEKCPVFDRDWNPKFLLNDNIQKNNENACNLLLWILKSQESGYYLKDDSVQSIKKLYYACQNEEIKKKLKEELNRLGYDEI